MPFFIALRLSEPNLLSILTRVFLPSSIPSLEMCTECGEIVWDPLHHKRTLNLINDLAFVFYGCCILRIHCVFGEGKIKNM